MSFRWRLKTEVVNGVTTSSQIRDDLLYDCVSLARNLDRHSGPKILERLRQEQLWKVSYFAWTLDGRVFLSVADLLTYEVPDGMLGGASMAQFRAQS